jgi:hypothetical protein
MDHLFQPRLDMLERAYVVIGHAPGIEALEGRFGKVPVRSVERIAWWILRGRKPGRLASPPGTRLRTRALTGLARVDQGAVEDTEPAVGIANALVEDQHGREISQVRHLWQEGIQPEIVDRAVRLGRRGSENRNAEASNSLTRIRRCFGLLRN